MAMQLLLASLLASLLVDAAAFEDTQPALFELIEEKHSTDSSSTNVAIQCLLSIRQISGDTEFGISSIHPQAL